MLSDDISLTNALVQLGRGSEASGRPVNLPIHQGSTMLFDTLAEFEAARAARYEQGTLYYGRYGNPASFELEQMMARLEGGHGCIFVSSGQRQDRYRRQDRRRLGDGRRSLPQGLVASLVPIVQSHQRGHSHRLRPFLFCCGRSA